MEKQNPKRRHHYIPVFYLNGFTGSDECLYVYNKDNKPVFKSSPEGIAYEIDYFSFSTSEGVKDSETIENNISELEGQFAPVINKISRHDELSVDDRILFSIFVASMMIRVPNMRNNIMKSTGEMLKHVSVFMASHKERFERMMEGYEKNVGEQIDMNVEELRQFMRNPNNYNVIFSKEYATAIALSLLEKLANTFFQMKWQFLEATDDYKYMTGDSPLQYIDPRHDLHSFRGVGIASSPNIEVSLPLSKNICAFGTWKHREGYGQAKNQHVKHLNKRTVAASVKFVFADKESKVIDEFVKKYKGSHHVAIVN